MEYGGKFEKDDSNMFLFVSGYPMLVFIGYVFAGLIFVHCGHGLVFCADLMVLLVDETACQLFIIPMIVALSVHYQNLEEDC